MNGMATSLQRLEALTDDALIAMITRLGDDVDTSQFLVQLANNPVVSTLADNPLSARAVDFDAQLGLDLARSQLASRLANEPIANQMNRNEALVRVAGFAPGARIAVQYADHQLALRLADSPLALYLADSAVGRRLAQRAYASRLSQSQLANFVNSRPFRTAHQKALLPHEPEWITTSPLANRLAKTEATQVPSSNTMLAARIVGALSATLLELSVVTQLLRLDSGSPSSGQPPRQEDRDSDDPFVLTVELPPTITEAQADELARRLEPLRKETQQLLDTGVFASLGLGIEDEVERTLDSLFDREFRPLDGRPISAPVALNLATRLLSYIALVEPDPVVSEVLETLERALHPPGGDSNAAFRTSYLLAEEADWDSLTEAIDATWNNYISSEELAGRDPDIARIELKKQLSNTSAPRNMVELLGWTNQNRLGLSMAGSAGASLGQQISMSLFGKSLPGLLLGACTYILMYFRETSYLDRHH